MALNAVANKTVYTDTKDKRNMSMVKVKIQVKRNLIMIDISLEAK